MTVIGEPGGNNGRVICKGQAMWHHRRKSLSMLAQYVYPSKLGLFRIIRHGRQWRVLCEKCEFGRHERPEAALIAARIACPQARLPGELGGWRYVPELALAHSRVSSGGTDWRLAG